MLNEKKEERGVKVIRGGVEKIVEVHQVVVGDIALLEPGEIIPCDGVFLDGHNVKCDESGATGESDAIRKVSYEDYSAMRRKGNERAHTDCFMISGSKVLEGYGRYVVIAVGTKSFNGRIMMGTSSSSALDTSSCHTGSRRLSHQTDIYLQRYVAIPKTHRYRRSSTISRSSSPSSAAPPVLSSSQRF